MDRCLSWATTLLVLILQHLHLSAPSFSYFADLDLFEKGLFLSCYQYSCWRKSEKMTEILTLTLSISPFYSEVFLYAFASCPFLKLFKVPPCDQNFLSAPDILYQSLKRCFVMYIKVFIVCPSADVCVACSIASMSETKKNVCVPRICSFIQHE